jgi:hypothetical protein
VTHAFAPSGALELDQLNESGFEEKCVPGKITSWQRLDLWQDSLLTMVKCLVFVVHRRFPTNVIRQSLLALLVSIAFVFPADAADLHRLQSRHVPAGITNLTAMGRAPASQRLNLAISLPLRKPQELDNLLQQLYDPTSANYHRYLTPEQFAARFGPSQADYSALVGFAQSNGLTVTVTHPNRLVLDVEAAVSDI